MLERREGVRRLETSKEEFCPAGSQKSHQRSRKRRGSSLNTMEINVKKNDNTIIFELEGSLDIYTSLDLKAALEEHVKDNNPDVVIDMEKLTYIDSSGIGILI